MTFVYRLVIMETVPVKEVLFMKKRSGPTVFLGTVTVILAITVLFFFCKGRDIVQKSIDAALSQDDTRLSALQQQIDELEKALAKMQEDADKKQRESEEKEAEWAKDQKLDARRRKSGISDL